jgi:hypothetical protein
MDFTSKNPYLAPLFTIEYKEDFFNFPNKKLPRNLRNEGASLYQALFGLEQDPEDFTLTLKSSEGDLERIYGPSVGKDPSSDSLALKWGEKYVVLVLDGANLIPPKLDNAEWNFETFAINEANFGYQTNETSLNVVLETDEGFIDASFPLRFKDPKNAPKYASFKTSRCLYSNGEILVGKEN